MSLLMEIKTAVGNEFVSNLTNNESVTAILNYL